MKLNRRQLRRLIMESIDFPTFQSGDSSHSKRKMVYSGVGPVDGPFTMTCIGRNSPNEWVCYVDYHQNPERNREFNIVGGFAEIQEKLNNLTGHNNIS